mgnify:FL=1
MMERHGRYSVCGVVGLALLLILAGCAGESTQAVLDLVPLQREMAAEYGGWNVVVECQHGDTLRFTMFEEAAGISPNEFSPERAQEIAEFVCEHYRSMDRIDMVEVAFEFRRDSPVGDASGRLAYAFARTELDCSER